MALNNARISAILPTTDLDRARVFYREKIGLKEVAYDNKMGFLEFEGANGTRLGVFQRNDVRPAEFTVAGFEVKNIEEAVTDLKKKGVTLEQYNTPDIKTNKDGIAEMGGSKTAWFRDPDGHYWAVNQMIR